MRDAASTQHLPDDLAFLAPFLSEEPRYRSAPWLLSAFDDPVWECVIDYPFQIDWRVRLAGKELLTAPQHSRLIESIKAWALVQTHVDVTGGKIQCKEIERRAVQRVIWIVDYMLLNAESLELHQHALDAISGEQLRAVLAQLSSSCSTSNTVYDWPTRLTNHLRGLVAKTNPQDITQAINDNAALRLSMPRTESFISHLSREELIQARAALWILGNYRRRSRMSGHGGFLYTPATAALAREIYKDTLWGHRSRFPMPTELALVPDYFKQTEFKRARVVSARDERISSLSQRAYQLTFRTLTHLRAEGFSAPGDTALSEKLAVLVETKPIGRFRTLPHHVVFDALRRAIEFFLEFSSPLIDSYHAILRAWAESGECFSVFVNTTDLLPYLDPNVVRLGVHRWSVQDSDGFAPQNPESYFAQLRSNQGLYESLRVLLGAAQIIIGALSARRSGELRGLRAGSALDDTGTRLVFRNRKSGPARLRRTEHRPIPHVATFCVSELTRMQSVVNEVAKLRSVAPLFAAPRQGNAPALDSDSSQYNSSIDFFCDWAETALDPEGNRYYIRQHQLRRFFAMLFFWGNSFGGMETLRWFLAQTDAQHLWHYITEMTPGAAVRSVAAQWAAHGLQHSFPEAEELSAIVHDRFQTYDFSVLDYDELSAYLESLLECGSISVEPVFLDHGRSYRIAVTVNKGV